MEKREFISCLREHLEGEVPSEMVKKNIRYYEDYIAENGKSYEEERRCIEEMGDPRLIATTIITSYKMSTGADQKEEYFEEKESSEENRNMRQTVPLKYKVIGIVSTVVLLFILIFILKVFVFVAARLLFPIAVGALVVVLINKLLRK